MDWNDIARIVFICVTVNHLGLIETIENVAKRELFIVNCPKCFTFWSVMLYGLLTLNDFITVLAVSFLASYTALWLELFEGFIDTLYRKFYEKIYADTTDYAATSDADDGHPQSTLSEL